MSSDWGLDHYVAFGGWESFSALSLYNYVINMLMFWRYYDVNMEQGLFLIFGLKDDILFIRNERNYIRSWYISIVAWVDKILQDDKPHN